MHAYLQMFLETYRQYLSHVFSVWRIREEGEGKGGNERKEVVFFFLCVPKTPPPPPKKVELMGRGGEPFRLYHTNPVTAPNQEPPYSSTELKNSAPPRRKLVHFIS